MTSGNAQQSDRRALGMPAILLPIAEGVDADAHGVSELSLGEPDKTSECGNVLAGLKLAKHEALSNTRGNGLGKVLVGQLGNLSHRLRSTPQSLTVKLVS